MQTFNTLNPAITQWVDKRVKLGTEFAELGMNECINLDLQIFGSCGCQVLKRVNQFKQNLTLLIIINSLFTDYDKLRFFDMQKLGFFLS